MTKFLCGVTPDFYIKLNGPVCYSIKSKSSTKNAKFFRKGIKTTDQLLRHKYIDY